VRLRNGESTHEKGKQLRLLVGQRDVVRGGTQRFKSQEIPSQRGQETQLQMQQHRKRQKKDRLWETGRKIQVWMGTREE